MVQTRSDSEAKLKVRDMIADIEVAMLVTMDAEGHHRGRPMRAVTQEGDDKLWFFTGSDSGLVHEAQEDERVLLTYADPRRQNYVAISGTARVVRDAAKQKELWSEPLRVWFPGGAEDPKVALLCVDMEGAEYWDAPSSTLVHAFGYLKAVTTGEPPHPGANDKVDFGKKAG